MTNKELAEALGISTKTVQNKVISTNKTIRVLTKLALAMPTTMVFPHLEEILAKEAERGK